MNYEKLKAELECKNPLFFFHDDPDGLASFLLLYRCLKEGHGVVVKSHPNVDSKFVGKVSEYSPDKIFILDLALVDDSFLDQVKVPVVWIDHHSSQEPRKTHYYNPRLENENIPTSLICYNIVEKDLWIAMAGIVGDWHFPVIATKFRKEHPKLLPANIEGPGQALFESQIGKLARIFSFILKGTTHEAMQCVKILTRIDAPEEVLEQTTDRGRFIYRRFEKINKEYEELLREAATKVTHNPFLVFVYPASKMSFTGDLSNELLYRFPDKIIIVGREKSGEVKCSLRANSKVDILSMVNKALLGVKGYGGGHEQACGAVVDVNDFDRFLNSLREQFQNPKAL